MTVVVRPVVVVIVVVVPVTVAVADPALGPKGYQPTRPPEGIPLPNPGWPGSPGFQGGGGGGGLSGLGVQGPKATLMLYHWLICWKPTPQ